MSDTIYKIFPNDPYTKYSDKEIYSAVRILNSYTKENIVFTNYNSTQFIDCGDKLSKFYCQWCGVEMKVEKWKELMDKAYKRNEFISLGFISPCCDRLSSLNELIYIEPCGFSTFVIQVYNPINVPCIVDLHEMGKCFKSSDFFRMISSHYK